MKKKKSDHVDAEVQIENALNETESFLERNSKKIMSTLVVVVLIALSIFGYRHLYQAPRQDKAAQAMFVAEQYFAQDSLALALNGDGTNDGFIVVADDYSMTASGNLAAHYAGVCFLKQGDLESALKYLKKYSKVSGASAEVINAQNKGLIGDIYSQQKDYKNAVSNYNDAVSMGDNNFTAPLYLKKAGMVYEELEKFDDALKCYETIKTEYFASMEARDIDKYISRVNQIKPNNVNKTK